MLKFTEWLQEKLYLIDLNENEDNEINLGLDVIPQLEVAGRNKVKDLPCNQHIFYKIIRTYDDVKEVILKHKSQIECIISFNLTEQIDAQGMMNYLCGGIYALEGEVREAGRNVFIVGAKAGKLDG